MKQKDKSSRTSTAGSKRKKTKKEVAHEEISSSRMVRRKIVKATLAFCAGIVSYITYSASGSAELADSRLFETIIVCAFSLAGSVIGFYIAGQTWDVTKFKRKE